MKRWLLALIAWWQGLGNCPDCQHSKSLHYADIDGKSLCTGHDPVKRWGDPDYWCKCRRGF